MAKIPTEAPRFPWWYRNPRRLDLITLLVALIPAAAGAVVMTWLQANPWEALPAAITIVGALASRRAPRIATLFVATAPPVSSLLEISPTLAWGLVVLTAPLLTLRGAPTVLVMWVGATANAVAVELYSLPRFELVQVSAAVLLVIASTATATALKKQIGYLQAMQERALEAIAERDREAERRIVEERLRIARDLHDVVGHKVALVSIQLSLAEVHAAKDAGQTKATLRQARGGIQSILHEMQRILEVLRFSEAEDVGRPTGGIDALPELIGSFRQVGMTVHADIDRVEEPVDSLVDTAIYRIAQESLTNAQKYGTGAARVSLRIADSTIDLRVSNAILRRAQTTGASYGLVGMRERVKSAGGTLDIVDDDGHFEVIACVPTSGEQS